MHTSPIFDIWSAVLSTVVPDVFALTTIHIFILGVIKGLKLNIFISFYFNLFDDIGEDHTLGELFLSIKSPGDTYPAGGKENSANFVTNVTLHFISTMTNLVKPQLLSSEK